MRQVTVDLSRVVYYMTYALFASSFQHYGWTEMSRATIGVLVACMSVTVPATLFFSSHLIFYSLKTVVKRNCIQSSYTYTYSKMLR